VGRIFIMKGEKELEMKRGRRDEFKERKKERKKEGKKERKKVRIIH